MWAIIPLKDPENAKSRLSNALDPGTRRSVYFLLAGHVIATLRRCSGITQVAVVTASAAAAEFAAVRGATVIRQDLDQGTSAAFAYGVSALRALNLQYVLFVPGDLPLLSVAAIETLLAARSAAPSMVIAPDRHATGTNALLCSPPDVIAYHFGSGSFQLHCRAAHACGASVRVVHSLEFGLDIDTSQDIDHLRCTTGGRTAVMRALLDKARAGTLLVAGETLQ